MRVQPNQEQFDAMNDTAFMDWWDETVEQVQVQADSENEVDEVCAARDAAFAARAAWKA